jgi:hypothetical protein
MSADIVRTDKPGDLATPTVYEIFERLVHDPSVDPARLGQLMELQERAEARQSEREFIAAFNRLQPRLPRITKHGKIDLGKGKPLAFAKFEDIDRSIRPLLAAEGFTLSYGCAPSERGLVITATLSHCAGHSRSESMPLPADEGPGRNKLQALGSTFSYGKRYLVCAMLNIITEGEDDDGSFEGYIRPDQERLLREAIMSAKIDESKLLAVYGVKALSDLPAANFGGVKAQITQKYSAAMKSTGMDDRDVAHNVKVLWGEAS